MGGGLTDKTNHFTTKSNIYTYNTLIRLIIEQKLLWAGLVTLSQPTHTASRLSIFMHYSIFTQFYATDKSHSFPELYLLPNTINCVSPIGSKI